MPSIESADFPHLFQRVTWGVVDCRFALLDALPPAELIGNVNIVPFIGEYCVLIQMAGGTWEIPGGTLELSETYLDAVRRELREEAGAALLSYHPVGAWACRSAAATPYRPHLPHPVFYRLVGWGEVRQIGTPENPAGGEMVGAVAVMPVEQAATRFLQSGRPDLADLYRLVGHLRAGQVAE